MKSIGGIPDLNIDGLLVPFPFEFIYPEQIEYMHALKRTLDAKGQGLIEMPTGTGIYQHTYLYVYILILGKTIAVFALILAYMHEYPQVGKLVFCTRTVPEMTKALCELRRLVEYRERVNNMNISMDGQQLRLQSAPFLAIGLSARKNLCVNPNVSSLSAADQINSKCRELLMASSGDIEDTTSSCGCPYFNQLNSAEYSLIPNFLAPKTDINAKLNGVYTIEDLRSIGMSEGWCPYYGSKRLLKEANVIVYSYQYLLDPGVSVSTQLFPNVNSSKLTINTNATALFTNSNNVTAPAANMAGKKDDSADEKEPAIVVFDEAHNIDDVCIECMTVKLNRHTIETASQNVKRLSREVQQLRDRSSERLILEYERLVQGLVASGHLDEDIASRVRVSNIRQLLATASGSSDTAIVPIPGSIRKAEHFLTQLQAVVVFLKQYIICPNNKARTDGPLMFTHKLEESSCIAPKDMKAYSIRLRSLMNTLKIIDVDTFTAISKVCEVVSMAATYNRGFALIVDPFPETEGVFDPHIELSCLDASIAMGNVTKRFDSVILTSGTLSPLNIYPKLLSLNRVVTSQALTISLARECIRPVVVTRNNDRVLLSSK